jgi:hypothetical protein
MEMKGEKRRCVLQSVSVYNGGGGVSMLTRAVYKTSLLISAVPVKSTYWFCFQLALQQLHSRVLEFYYPWNSCMTMHYTITFPIPMSEL